MFSLAIVLLCAGLILGILNQFSLFHRLVAAMICLIFFPSNWNIEGLHDHYLMVFKPKEWQKKLNS